MARRRRVEEPVEEQQSVRSEAREEAPVSDANDAMERDDEGGEEGEMRSLQFDQELSWRPAKPIPSATLLSRLEALSKELASFEQGTTNLVSLKDVASKLAHRNLLQHKDRGVKAYTACCLVDLLWLFAPEAPFNEEQLKVGSQQQQQQPNTEAPPPICRPR